MRKVIQIISLVVFTTLMFFEKTQLWGVVFLSGLFLSTIKGRIYCGWICPINTAIEITSIYKKKKIKTPKFFKNNWVRISILVFFIFIFIFIKKLNIKLQILPLLFILGIMFSLFMEPAFWHRYLCPYGTLFSFFSKKAKVGYFVNQSDCVKCGACATNCPSHAIKQENKEFPIINNNECLVCGKCSNICPTKTIKYKKNR